MRNERAITTILFDAGGVLVHLDYSFLARGLRAAGIQVISRDLRRAEYAAKIEIDRTFREVLPSTDETRRQPYFFVLLQQLGIEAGAAHRLLQQFETEHRRDNLWRLRLPSTPGVLTDLCAQGITLGVISNADGRIAAILEKAGIAQFFDVIIDSYVVGVEKPDPAIFRIALDRMGVKPEHAIFVGDIYAIDVLGAERAGLQPVLVDMLGAYKNVRCRKIQHLRELLSCVEEKQR